MNFDQDKVDEMALALLFLTLHDGNRAWKGMDWDVLERLCTKGLIYDAANKSKSVALTDEGLIKCRELFLKHFGAPPPRAAG